MKSQEQMLEEGIERFYGNKTEADSWKKLADKDNKLIKELMEDLKFTDFEYKGIKAKRSVSERISFIDDALIEKLKELNMTDLIKTKEFVDLGALETAIYKGDLDPKELIKCQEVKEVVTLRVTGPK